jgi:GR25 family glycosyltransferase involved in LPS biosynthesis
VVVDDGEGAVVFEDDVAFDRNLHDEIEQIIINIETKQIDFDIIFLGNLNDNCGEHVVHNVYKINNYQECWGTHALLIKNKNIEKIYNSLLNIRAQIDIHYASLIKDQTLNGFVIFPSICRQKDDFNSTIK